MRARETTGAPARAAARRERAARRMLRRRRVVAGAGAAALVAGLGGAAVFGMMADGRDAPDAGAPASASPAPPAASALPVPQQTGAPAAPVALCDREDVQRALADGDDAAVIEAAGGGEGFRRAVAGEAAPCIDLRDPDRIWLVVNKTHPLDPIDAVPYDWTVPQGTRNAASVFVRPDVTDSLADISAGVAATGLGEMGLQSGFRGYAVQQRIHAQQVAALGRDAGEELAARPGYSEHQTGLAVDIFACTPGCGPIDAFGDTAVGEWVAENAWRYGWIVRYAEGRTDVTGYVPEAWHLRYIGPQLAEAYYEGAYDTLEQFFGLAPAPDYPD